MPSKKTDPHPALFGVEAHHAHVCGRALTESAFTDMDGRKNENRAFLASASAGIQQTRHAGFPDGGEGGAFIQQ
jgi:hypothetical protein